MIRGSAALRPPPSPLRPPSVPPLCYTTDNNCSIIWLMAAWQLLPATHLSAILCHLPYINFYRFHISECKQCCKTWPNDVTSCCTGQQFWCVKPSCNIVQQMLQTATLVPNEATSGQQQMLHANVASFGWGFKTFSLTDIIRAMGNVAGNAKNGLKLAQWPANDKSTG